jgi:hypothetical protein
MPSRSDAPAAALVALGLCSLIALLGFILAVLPLALATGSGIAARRATGASDTPPHP